MFDLGGDLGQWRIDSNEVDSETTRPSELDEVLVQRTIHKTAHTILGLLGAVFKSQGRRRETPHHLHQVEHRGRGERGDKLHLEAPVQQGAQAGAYEHQ